jgi:aminopeptidase N
MKLTFLLALASLFAFASDPYKKNDNIDIRHYEFTLEVNDSTDVLSGKATIEILFKKSTEEFELDLINGMEVTSILKDGKPVRFIHQNNRIKIILSSSAHSGNLTSFVITYKGIPQDGLIIGKNKFKDRGFFGDNWPDRGHHWLPVVDHPSDKASVDFIIIAPSHYQVVSNGIRIEESMIDSKRKLTHWREEADIPVKVMVVGIAPFAIQYVGKVDDIMVESWVYPQNKAEGFSDYAIALKVLDYFHHHIGPYPYKKLANVQSKTRWGGLENASAIFYAESTVDGKGSQERLIAHEVAHQWFGNSASEKDWHHVWLSEGSATYFSNLYMEYSYGYDVLKEEQKKERAEVVAYFGANPGPVVDTTIHDINTILNPNTYQKAGWVLHMLRHRIGDIAFWNGVQKYYSTYRNANALTGDFQRLMEEASGTNLSEFFSQWLWHGGHPKITGTWHYNPASKEISVIIDQVQTSGLFNFPLEIGVRTAKSGWALTTVSIAEKTNKIQFASAEKPEELVLDPNVWLLFEGKISP